MSTVRLFWKPRVSKKKRAAILKWVKQHYRSAKDLGDYIELHAPNHCTKFVWIFMFSKAFRDLQ